MHIVFTALPTLVIGVFLGSICEWTLHRYLMHQPQRLLRYPYNRHARVHHVIFRSDASYHLLSERDETKVAMAWWNWLILIPLGMVPYGIPAGTFVCFDLWAEAWTALICGVTVVSAYYCAYEYLHWCMHVPRNRWFEHFRIYVWLKEHHRLHHKSWRRNLNVVLPICDLCFGTLSRQKMRHAPA